jgi:hypothetical protein
MDNDGDGDCGDGNGKPTQIHIHIVHHHHPLVNTTTVNLDKNRHMLRNIQSTAIASIWTMMVMMIVVMALEDLYKSIAFTAITLIISVHNQILTINLL